jgi:hypothetical protein
VRSGTLPARRARAARYRADMKARPRKTSQPTTTSAVTAPAVMRAISFGVGGLSIFAVALTFPC